MKDKVIVSIIVPIYNMGRYLDVCIKSLLTQTYEFVEVILIDDGSKDNSLQICKGYADRYYNVKVISQENSGVSVARNIGLDNCIGKWIMFVDPDDFVSEDIVEKLLNQVDNYTDIVACTCVAFENENKAICHFYDGNKSYENFEQKKELYKQLMKMGYGQKGKVYTAIGVPWGKIYSRNLLNDTLRFNPKLRRVQDNIFNMEAFLLARKIKYIDSPLYYYRFEHMDAYFTKYNNNFTGIYTAVCEARWDLMTRYNLLSDAELYKYYENEIISNLACIMRYDIFHKDNLKSRTERNRSIDNLSTQKWFKETVSLRNIRSLDSIKKKVFLILLTLKRYELLEIIFNLI